MSYTTHIVHWLLVYLGIFDELEWFRFEAGHSHTEISDRLFGLIKKLLASESGSRVNRCATFQELFAKIDKALAKCPEIRAFEYDLANWDFERWLEGMNVPTSEGTTTTRGLFEGQFARYTFDNVYRYEYVESLWQHGGVKVTYKERLSYSAGENDAEYSPVVARERPPVGGANLAATQKEQQVQMAQQQVSDPHVFWKWRKPPSDGPSYLTGAGGATA